MNDITVFISYSHDSDAHRERVLGLSERLREDGITTILDQYVNGSPAEGWERWMMNGLDSSTFVLCVCTETYNHRFLGHEEFDQGKGVDWEGMLLTRKLYNSRSTSNKFIPVLFDNADKAFVPEPLGLTFYVLDSEKNYQGLYDVLLDQSGIEPAIVGKLKSRPRETGKPIEFDDGASETPIVDITRIIKYAPAELIGREVETGLLDKAWSQVRNNELGRPHVLAFVALGGEGKTSLVAKWAAELGNRDWPGCDAVFAWSFYSQGSREQIAVSSELFLSEALTFFGDAEMARSAQGAFDKGKRLAHLIAEQRVLLILDGLEPLQYALSSPTPGMLNDQGVNALLCALAANSNGLCLLTTRYEIPDLQAWSQTTAIQHELLRLSKEAGVALLHSMKGGTTKNPVEIKGTQDEFETLVEDVDGHALTLQIVGQFLLRAHHGDIRRRGLIDFEKADSKIQGGHAFRAMQAYVTWLKDDSDESRRELAVLKILGLFDRPASADCINALLKAPAIDGLTEPLVGLAGDDWLFTLTGLEAARMITLNRAGSSGELLSLDAHPLLREYFARYLQEQSGDAWRAAHRRLYEHLCENTQEGEMPTLEDLQPLYQAVAHGCYAGLMREACGDVYHDRINRGGENYSSHKLGAFGSDLAAVACFFDTPWSRVSTAIMAAAQAWLLNEAATRLRALGRLTEALEPMRVSREMNVKVESWKGAAICYGNLSELELTLGELSGAVVDAESSVTYADRSGDAFWRMASRTKHADALYQSGRRDEAESLFREAEYMQAERQPDYALLYSLQGFQYCDLLLAQAESAAWQRTLVQARNRDLTVSHAMLDRLQTVKDRATKTLKWMEQAHLSLLSIALDHLTLARTNLYTTILQQSSVSNHQPEIEAAVSGLRSAGQLDQLPKALLTRAWQRTLTANLLGPDSAQSDLDEAWQIAERGPMPLYLADIHLHRARLFASLDPQEYPWQSTQHDLSEARRLIEKHGYGRRTKELEDAEAIKK